MIGFLLLILFLFFLGQAILETMCGGCLLIYGAVLYVLFFICKILIFLDRRRKTAALCVLGICAATAISYAQTNETPITQTATAPNPNMMPVSRTLTSADGRTIEVVITAKTPTAIMVNKADGKKFEIALDKLSATDKAFVAGLVEPPFRKMRVLTIGDIRPLTEKMKPTEFAITEVYETNALQKLSDQELESFDAIIVTREGCSRKWSAGLGNTPIEKWSDVYIQRDRILKLTDQGKVVAWRSYHKIDKKELIATKEQPERVTGKGERLNETPFVDVQGNAIFFSWTSETHDRQSTRKNEDSEGEIPHPEFLDRTIVELKRLVQKQAK